MTTKRFQAELVARLREVAGSVTCDIGRLRMASAEALKLCAHHPDIIPERAIAGFEVKYGGLWKNPEKRDIV